jgi:hypothetical protein
MILVYMAFVGMCLVVVALVLDVVVGVASARAVTLSSALAKHVEDGKRPGTPYQKPWFKG